MMEEKSSLQSTLTIPSLLPQTHAADYTNRYPKTYGQQIGILTSTDISTYNTPAQEVPGITEVDLTTTTDFYIAHLSDSQKME